VKRGPRRVKAPPANKRKKGIKLGGEGDPFPKGRVLFPWAKVRTQTVEPHPGPKGESWFLPKLKGKAKLNPN